MAIANGLLSNPVLAGLLGGGGPAAIKARKEAELAALRKGTPGGRIAAPGVSGRAPAESLGRGLSSLGASLQGIADMRKKQATRQAIIDSRAPITTTKRVMTAPQSTVDVPDRFSQPESISAMSMSGGEPTDPAKMASQMMAAGNPNEQKIGSQAQEFLNMANRPVPAPATPDDADLGGDPVAERNMQIQMDMDERLGDNFKAADLLNLQYTPGYKKVVEATFEDQERTRKPTLFESADYLLSRGEIAAGGKLAAISQSQEATKTARIKADAALATANNSGLNDPEKRLKVLIKVQDSHFKSAQYTNFQDGDRNYDALVAASKRNDPVADLDMVFSIAKMWDPDSVVRENEQRSISNTGGVPDYLYALFQSVKGGERLTDQTKQRMLASGRQRMDFFKRQYKDRVLLTKRTADKFGFEYGLVGLSESDAQYFPVKYKFGNS